MIFPQRLECGGSRTGVRNGKGDLNPKTQILDPQKAVNTAEKNKESFAGL